MKIKFFFLLLLIAGSSYAQQHKTKNEIIVLMDGYRWKELFRGADSALLFGEKYNSQDSAWLSFKIQGGKHFLITGEQAYLPSHKVGRAQETAE